MKQGRFSETPREFVAIFGVLIPLAALFIVLRTRQYLAVDGAIRCLTVYWRAHPTTGGNNHLLSLRKRLRLDEGTFTPRREIKGRVRFYAPDALDERVCGGWINSDVWVLCCRAARSFVAAFAASCAYAFSNAFLLHATSTAEPMMGLFWSIVDLNGRMGSGKLLAIATVRRRSITASRNGDLRKHGADQVLRSSLICNWDERGDWVTTADLPCGFWPVAD